MTPDINDKFTFVGLATKTKLTAPKGIGATDIDCEDLDAWQTAAALSAVFFGIDRVDLNGVRIPGTYTEWKGLVAGDSVGSLQHVGGANDQEYPADEYTRVYMVITAAWANSLITGLLVSLKQNGALKAGAVDSTDVLADAIVTPAKMLNPYRFRAHATADQTGIATGTWTTVALGTEDFDPGGVFASNTFTALVTGDHHFDGSVFFGGSPGLILGGGVRLLKNGTTVVSEMPGWYDNNVSYDGQGYSLSDTVRLAAGDTIVLQGKFDVVSGAVTFNGGEKTKLAGFLVAQV